LRDLDAGEGRALGRRAASEGGTLRVRGFQQPSACLGDVPLAAKEIYASDERHRFDILVTILNQLPGSLRAIAQRAQRWRSGAGGTNGDTAVCRMEVADRVFVVGVHMTKERPLDGRSWADSARMISYDLAKRFGATDCVIILKVRRSRFLTFDGIGFFRFPQNASRA
jgi:hypothetical protein